MRGLPAKDYVATYLPDTVPEFLRVFRFKTPFDEEGGKGSGFSPLMLSVASGNLKVATDLVMMGADVHCVLRLRQMRMAYRIFGFPDDSSVLHAAVSVCPNDHDAMVALLVSHNADLNRRTRTGFGFTPLMAAVAMDNLGGVKALVKLPEIDLERGLRTNSATALGCAAYLSTFEVVEVLVAAGASRTHMNEHGGSKLTDACQNPAADKRMLDLLWNQGELDVNHVFKPRNMKWYLIDRYFEAALKYSLIPKSDIVMGMAHTRGSSPLHLASMFGHLEHVQWLLSHGGMASLHIRNEMGCTPMDVARIFGRHAEVEALLGASMMNLTFHLQGERMRGIPSGRRATAAYGRDATDLSPRPLAPTYMFQSTPRYMFQSTPLASSVLASSIIGTLY
jgi:ankyrin repeat protein